MWLHRMSDYWRLYTTNNTAEIFPELHSVRRKLREFFQPYGFLFHFYSDISIRSLSSSLF